MVDMAPQFEAASRPEQCVPPNLEGAVVEIPRRPRVEDPGHIGIMPGPTDMGALGRTAERGELRVQEVIVSRISGPREGVQPERGDQGTQTQSDRKS